MANAPQRGVQPLWAYIAGPLRMYRLLCLKAEGVAPKGQEQRGRSSIYAQRGPKGGPKGTSCPKGNYPSGFRPFGTARDIYASSPFSFLSRCSCPFGATTTKMPSKSRPIKWACLEFFKFFKTIIFNCFSIVFFLRSKAFFAISFRRGPKDGACPFAPKGSEARIAKNTFSPLAYIALAPSGQRAPTKALRPLWPLCSLPRRGPFGHILRDAPLAALRPLWPLCSLPRRGKSNAGRPFGHILSKNKCCLNF